MTGVLHLSPATGTVVTRLRQTTGSIAGGADANVAINFPQAMTSTAYTVSATVENSDGDLTVRCVLSRMVNGVTVRVRNNNTLTARTGTVHVLVIAD
jgi:hypothetical protein